MSLLHSILTVVRFESKRSLTASRMLWWLVLALFAPVLLSVIRTQEGALPPDAAWIAPIIVYVLCPGVVCMLGVFLWTSPILLSELEGRSWVYLAVRPRGALAVILGKCIVAVAWTLPAAVFGSAVSILILAHDNFVQLIWVESKLALLSCVAYCAVFSLIGALFPKRAMVIGVFYVVVFEVVLALVPAAVNLFTFQYRLRCLYVRWFDLDPTLVGKDPVFLAYFGEESAAWHVGVMLAMTAGVFLATACAVQWNEFTAEAETDV